MTLWPCRISASWNERRDSARGRDLGSTGLSYERLPWHMVAAAWLPADRALPPRSPQVCACHDVSQAQIVDTLAACDGSAPDRLVALQRQLKCGTECGSCLPAVRELIRLYPAATSPVEPLVLATPT